MKVSAWCNVRANQVVSMGKILTTFGLEKYRIIEQLDGLQKRFSDVHYELIDVFPEIHIRLYPDKKGSDAPMAGVIQAVTWIVRELGDHVLDPGGGSMAEIVGKLLFERGATVSVAESCTGGLISHLLTGVAGSSDYFLFSGVTYSNRSKIDVLGVSSATIARCGAVDEETAREMAEGTRRISGAHYGISTTGIAGPGGGTQTKPVGTVCIGLAAPGGSYARRFHFSCDNRSMNKRIFAFAALDLLRRELITGIDRGEKD